MAPKVSARRRGIPGIREEGHFVVCERIETGKMYWYSGKGIGFIDPAS